MRVLKGLHTWQRVEGQELSLGGRHRDKCVERRGNCYCIWHENSEKTDRIQFRAVPWMPNQGDRRVRKILWSMVSKAADRSRRQRHEIWREPIALIRWSCILPTLDFFLPTGLPSWQRYWTGPIMLTVLFLVSHFNVLFVPCGGLSWLPVSFLLHVKYTLSYRIVSSNELGKLLQWLCYDSTISIVWNYYYYYYYYY